MRTDDLQQLRIRTRDRGDITVLELEGRLDTPDETKLIREIRDLASSGVRKVLVDGSRLRYLSSRGVSAFIAVLDDLRAAGGDLKLVGLGRQAKLILDRLGLSALIQEFAYLDAGLQAFAVPIEEYFSPTGLDRFLSSEKGKVFHASSCRSAARIRTPVEYPSKEFARKAGLNPCKRCL